MKAKSNRIPDIDFWRGAVLIAILVDHIPGNPLEHFTPRNFGLSDSAEAFVFLSGLSVGLIYAPRAHKYGMEPVAGGCLRRALKLYGVHIALTLAALMMFGAAYWLSGVPELVQAHGRAFVFGSPASGLLGLALLVSARLFQYSALVYRADALGAGHARAGAPRSSRGFGRFGRALCGGSGFGLNLPNWPEPGGWFFNPIAWQLIFMLGLVAAILWRDGLPRPTPWLIALSAATVAGAALIVTNEAGLAPGLRDAATAHLDVAKQGLGLARLIHFVALAYLIAVATMTLRRFVAPMIGSVLAGRSRSWPQQPAGFRRRLPVERLGQAVLTAASPHSRRGSTICGTDVHNCVIAPCSPLSTGSSAEASLPTLPVQPPCRLRAPGGRFVLPSS